MNTFVLAALLLVNLLLLPLLLAGLMRKVKAWMQNRSGPPLLQPLHDLAKLLRKGQTVSGSASWIFSLAPQLGLAVALLAAVLVPWAGVILPAGWAPATNFLLVLYLLALGKFFAMLAALDTGSAFGGLGGSREATVTVMVEPALVLALAALAVSAGSMDLLTIYTAQLSPGLALLAGMALFMAALCELSRMPVDDPTTHLELTMIHEAGILEYSGAGLAAIEFGVALRSCIYLGLASQTLLHLWPAYHELAAAAAYAVSLGALFVLGSCVAIAEGVLVKLNWRKVPSFVSYAGVFSLLAALLAAARG